MKLREAAGAIDGIACVPEGAKSIEIINAKMDNPGGHSPPFLFQLVFSEKKLAYLRLARDTWTTL
jgi:hypothetical protein